MEPADVLISQTSDAPAFVQYVIKKSITDMFAHHQKWELYKKLESLFDERRLLHNKIQQWVQGISKAVSSVHFKLPSKVKELKQIQSGPAS